MKIIQATKLNLHNKQIFMFLENIELCYSLNVEICIVVLWHRMKRSKREKFNEPIFCKKKILCGKNRYCEWERNAKKIAQITYYVKMSLLLPKLVSLSYIKSIIYVWFGMGQFLCSQVPKLSSLHEVL